MKDVLQNYMKAIESDPTTSQEGTPPPVEFAALAGLGSKYLAIGSPDSLGLIVGSEFTAALTTCHTQLFGPLDVIDSDVVGIECAMAADIVCLCSSTEFEMDWIAEATHLNIVDDGSWSRGMQALAQSCALTYVRAPPSTEESRPRHGLLSDVITGSVSGRMGEEITVLVCRLSASS